MKHLILTIFCLLAASAVLLATQVAAGRPPNIVFFLVDDLGHRDVGCYGSTFYETPHIDRLAKEGAKFTDAYTASPVCSPTRASIMTGQWPQRTGVTDYSGAPTPEQWKRNTKNLPAPYADRLALDMPTLGKAMKAVEYQTFFAGKWHLGPEGWLPQDQGFDINVGGNRGGGPSGGNYFSPYGNPNMEDGPDGEHLTDRLAEETSKFISDNRGKPFFAFFSFYSVHGGSPAAAVRRGDYKLIESFEEGTLKLFNLADDIGEKQDLASTDPERVANLRDELRTWQKDVGAKFASPNPNYNPNRPDGRDARRPQGSR